MTNERVDTLQAGRGLAALAVVVHHAALAAHDFGGWYMPIFTHGYIGVDFFFVLSGFIIAFSIKGKTVGSYAWHRARRVFLPYLPAGIGIAVLYKLIPQLSAADREWSWLASLFLLPIGDPALSVAWTLQHEILFYAMFGLAWFSGRMWLLAIWGALCLIPSNLILLKVINLEFLMGVLCFYAVKAGIGSRWFYAASIIPIAIWIYSGAPRDASVLVGLTIAIGLPALIRTERQGLRIPRLLIFLGEASYSIYLVHGLAISLAARISANMLWCSLVGVVGGIIYYYCVERPVLALVSKRTLINSSDTKAH